MWDASELCNGKQRRLVSSTASGTLGYSDIAAHQDRLKDDPDFNPGFDQLFDGTRVTRIALTVEEIQTERAEDPCRGFPSSLCHEQRVGVRYGPNVRDLSGDVSTGRLVRCLTVWRRRSNGCDRQTIEGNLTRYRKA